MLYTIHRDVGGEEGWLMHNPHKVIAHTGGCFVWVVCFVFLSFVNFSGLLPDKGEVMHFEGDVFLALEPQEIEADFSLGDADRGIIMVDPLSSNGKRSVFALNGGTRKERARKKRCLRSWMSNFCANAHGRVSVHTYLRVNGTITIYPASEDLKKSLLGDRG